MAPDFHQSDICALCTESPGNWVRGDRLTLLALTSRIFFYFRANCPQSFSIGRDAFGPGLDTGPDRTFLGPNPKQVAGSGPVRTFGRS